MEHDIDPLYEAVKYVLDRVQTDPDVRYYCGWGTETFAKLCRAEAQHLGKPLAEVEKRRMVDLQPVYRKREPEVVVLRHRLEELELERA